MALSARFSLNGSRIIHEDFENEVVIVNLDSGRYYCLQQAGAEIWRLILAGHRAGEIAAVLAGRYAAPEAEIGQALDTLLGDMREQALITIADEDGPAATPSAPSSDQPRQPFEPPHLQVYTDMQDLLLLDPIHEVDPQGWPVVRNADNGEPR